MHSCTLLFALLSASLFAGACGGPASAENAVRAQKEYELAVGLMGEQNIAAAFEHLFKSIELDSKNPESHLLLGNLYLLREDFAKAEEELREAKKLALKNEQYGPPFIAEVENGRALPPDIDRLNPLCVKSHSPRRSG